jgi:hypothetical protein
MPPHRHLLRLLLAAVLLAVSGGLDPAAVGDDAYDASMCQKSFKCGGHDINYPFYLSNQSRLIDGVAYSRFFCGYPGMAILCDATTATATLRLAGGTNYTVLAIDYANHTITLADADALASNNSCPRPRHNVTIPPAAWLNFTATGNSTISFFLDCNLSAAADPPPPGIVPINCTGFAQGRSPSFLAPHLGAPEGNWSRACREVYVAPVLTEWLESAAYRPRLASGGYGDVLRRGFRLSWDPSSGPCYECELSRGQCGYDQVGGFLGCLCPDGRVRGPDCGKTTSFSLQY